MNSQNFAKYWLEGFPQAKGLIKVSEILSYAKTPVNLYDFSEKQAKKSIKRLAKVLRKRGVDPHFADYFTTIIELSDKVAGFERGFFGKRRAYTIETETKKGVVEHPGYKLTSGQEHALARYMHTLGKLEKNMPKELHSAFLDLIFSFKAISKVEGEIPAEYAEKYEKSFENLVRQIFKNLKPTGTGLSEYLKQVLSKIIFWTKLNKERGVATVGWYFVGLIITMIVLGFLALGAYMMPALGDAVIILPIIILVPLCIILMAMFSGESGKSLLAAWDAFEKKWYDAENWKAVYRSMQSG